MFYVYKWYNLDNNEVFYVGKGCKNRYKDKKHRNKKFLEYIEQNPNVKSEIVKFFNDEDEAFLFEHNLILKLKKENMCSCNLDYGGKGGCNFVWTSEMREYKSKYNPMKSLEQRKKMSINNPMKNFEVAMKNGLARSKIIIYDNKEYYCNELAKKFNVTPPTVFNWIDRGYAPDYKDCYYKEEGPKPFVIATHAASTRPVYIDNIYFESVKKASEYLGKKNSGQLIKHLKTDQIYLGHSCKYANQQPSLENVK